MSCNCNSTPCNCNPCCPQNPACDPTNEPLARSLSNFILEFFGVITKVCNDDGEIDWELPCDLSSGVDGWPRVTGEGLACYLKRLIEAEIKEILSGLVASASNGTYVIARNIPYGGIIQSISTKTSSGTLTLAVQIDGVSVTGLSAISVTNGALTSDASALNTFTTGQTIQLVVSGAAAPVNFDFTIYYEKRP